MAQRQILVQCPKNGSRLTLYNGFYQGVCRIGWQQHRFLADDGQCLKQLFARRFKVSDYVYRALTDILRPAGDYLVRLIIAILSQRLRRYELVRWAYQSLCHCWALWFTSSPHGRAMNTWRSKATKPQVLPIGCLHRIPLWMVSGVAIPQQLSP